MDINKKYIFDPRKLAEIVNEVIGGKTIKQVCDETSLSRSIVSRLLNGSITYPPTVRTIYRFANGNSEVAEKLLDACGYPKSLNEKLSIDEESPNGTLKTSKHTETYATNKIAGLLITLSILESNGCTDHVDISYKGSGLFRIETHDGKTVVGIPAMLSDTDNVYDVLSTTIDRFKEEIQKNKKKPLVFYILFTSSREMYDIISKRFPNLYYNMGVMLIDDSEQIESCLIEPLDKDNRIGGEMNIGFRAQ